MTKQYFKPSFLPPDQIDFTEAFVFIFHHDKIIINSNENLFPIPTLTPDLKNILTHIHYLGKLNDKDCFCAHLENPERLPEFTSLSLRRAYARLSISISSFGDDLLFAIACRAIQVIYWDRNHQFCSRCGSTVIMQIHERVKVCQQCDLHFYPKFSPSIIVAVEKNHEILLARSPRFYPGVYSVLAGFIEAGESAEDTIHREILEEVGLKVHKLRYFGSQSWPFPDSFMLGFIADYLSGEIIIDQREIIDAQWFNIDNLPQLPSPPSIARKLIDQFILKNINQT